MNHFSEVKPPIQANTMTSNALGLQLLQYSNSDDVRNVLRANRQFYKQRTTPAIPEPNSAPASPASGVVESPTSVAYPPPRASPLCISPMKRKTARPPTIDQKCVSDDGSLHFRLQSFRQMVDSCYLILIFSVMLAYRKLHFEHMFGIVDFSERINNFSMNFSFIRPIFYWGFC